MLKVAENGSELEYQAAEAVRALLEAIPVVGLEKIERAPAASNYDLTVVLNVGDHPRVLVCEVKSSGQPRHVRAALLQLQRAAGEYSQPATPVFIAPYLSPEAQALCRDFDVGFLDFVGNVRLVFDTVFIERQVDAKPPAVQRNLKSIFKPKSAQVLRVLLRDPGRPWRVVDLAQASNVSLGHVSNVRSELVDREWAEITDGGIRLSNPDALLDAWREVYEPPHGERVGFYTTLHGQSLDAGVHHVLQAGRGANKAILASFSAAHWLAPYGRMPAQYFYADTTGLAALRDALKLAPVRSGANVIVTVLKDQGLFRDAVEPAPGIISTGPVQTYLDLSVAGERGAEAADHLRQELLAWRK